MANTRLTTKHLWSIALFAVFLCLFSGCGSRRVPRSAIIGTYTVTYEPWVGTNLGTETIMLRADGICEQVFHPTRGKGWKNECRWQYLQEPHGTMIHFEDRMEALDEWGSKIRPKPILANGYYPVESRGRSVRIVINDDLGYYFRKVE